MSIDAHGEASNNEANGNELQVCDINELEMTFT